MSKESFKPFEKLNDYLNKAIVFTDKATDKIYLYNNQEGIYMNNETDIKRDLVVKTNLGRQAHINEVYNLIPIKAKRGYINTDKSAIAVANGLLIFDNNQVVYQKEYTSSRFILNKIPTHYQKVSGETMDFMRRTLLTWSNFDVEIYNVIAEMLGYLLLPQPSSATSFLLTSDGETGKSTFLKMVRKFIGQVNTSSVSLEDLGHNFRLSSMVGKLVNIGDDIAAEYVGKKSWSIFKQLVSGEVLQTEAKGKDAIDYENSAKLLFSCNGTPSTSDTSWGINRRLMIIPFEFKFRGSDKKDPNFINKITSQECLSALLNIAMEGLQRLLDNKMRFSESKAIDRAKQEFIKSNNIVALFVEEYMFIKDGMAIKEAYEDFCEFCNTEGKRQLTKQNFTEAFIKLGYYKKKTTLPSDQLSTWRLFKEEK